MSAKTDSGGSRLWRVHLDWMFENQPDFVRELHREGKLREHVEAKYQQALGYADTLMQERGISSDEAFEIATALFLAPADGSAMMSDDPPEPVPWQEQEAIWRALWPDD